MDLTPQQEKFLAAYLDPKSETWSNALQSALKAGYTREYAESITAKGLDWLSEYGGDNKLINKALKNLEIALEGGLDTEEGSKMIQWKSTETTLKSLLNNKFGDKKNVDITSKGEKINLTTEHMEIAKKYEEELKGKL